jgi:hypothetical protein
MLLLGGKPVALAAAGMTAGLSRRPPSAMLPSGANGPVSVRRFWVAVAARKARAAF